MDVRFEVIEPMRVAYVHHIGPYSECGSAWGNLGAWLGKEGLLGSGTTFIGLCYDDRVDIRHHLTRKRGIEP